MSENVEDGKAILYLGNKLQSKGLNPTLVDSLSELFKDEGFKVFAYSSIQNKSARFLDMLRAVIKHRKNADIALIDTYSTSAFWFAYYSARLLNFLKIPYIPILHGGALPKRFTTHEKEVLWFLSHSKVNVSPSDFLYEFFKNKGINNLKKIQNSLELEKYRYKIRHQIQPNLLWVRAFADIYNPLLAIKTLELVLDKYPEAKLSMVGPSKDQSFQQCKRYAEERKLPVSFTGQLSKQEWISYSENFDIFINTTNIDNTPVSVIEAMALGMPVISTNVGGIPYLLKNKENALLVESQNKGEMSDAIINLIEDNTLSSSLSKNARLKAEEFGWSCVKEKWFDILA